MEVMLAEEDSNSTWDRSRRLTLGMIWRRSIERMKEVLGITTQHPGMEQKRKIPLEQKRKISLEQKGDLVQDKEQTYTRRT